MSKNQGRLHIDKRADAVIKLGEILNLPSDALLTTRELASWLGCSRNWLEISRMKGSGPPWRRQGPNQVRYLKSDVVAWLDKRKHLRTSEYADPRHSRRKNPPGAATNAKPEARSIRG
jgi:predicted DNA-binding transcriptional regulator AlpA